MVLNSEMQIFNDYIIKSVYYPSTQSCQFQIRPRLSLSSTHAFRLSPAKFFSWDMCRVVKRIELVENISFALFTFEVQTFQLRRNFLTAKPIRLLSLVTWTFHKDQNIFTKWPPHSFIRPKRKRPQYILKTRIIELETSFRLRQFFAATVTKWRLVFLPKCFSLTKNIVSDRRNV